MGKGRMREKEGIADKVLYNSNSWSHSPDRTIQKREADHPGAQTNFWLSNCLSYFFVVCWNMELIKRQG